MITECALDLSHKTQRADRRSRCSDQHWWSDLSLLVSMGIVRHERGRTWGRRLDVHGRLGLRLRLRGPLPSLFVALGRGLIEQHLVQPQLFGAAGRARAVGLQPLRQHLDLAVVLAAQHEQLLPVLLHTPTRQPGRGSMRTRQGLVLAYSRSEMQSVASDSGTSAS